MSKWFSKSLGDGMLAWDPLEQIKELFLSRYAKTGCPKDMAIFIRHESEGRLHCEVKAYFSPAAIGVAREVEAEPCGKPSPAGLSLLVGSEESWLTLFPEGKG